MVCHATFNCRSGLAGRAGDILNGAKSALKGVALMYFRRDATKEMRMATTMKAEQLRIWDDEAGFQMKFAAITELQQWCASLRTYGLTTPTLDPSDKRTVAFASAFHDVIADFEEVEAPALRRERSLTERLIALRLLQGAIDECRHRSIRVPREIHRLRTSISRQIYSEKRSNAASNEQQAR